MCIYGDGLLTRSTIQNRFETDINNLKKALTLKEAHLAEMNEKEKDK